MAENAAEALRLVEAHAHWYHQIEVMPGVTTPGISPTQMILDAIRLPEDLTGLRVLDIGARDGFFSFECERRGAAEVVAIDYMDPEETGFPIARELLSSKVELRQANVYDLDPADLGTFDLVLFLGVLYHLRDPMLALDRIAGIATGELLIETQAIDEAVLVGPEVFKTLAEISAELVDIPLMQFYPGDSLNGDPTNVWAPNQACLRAMLAETGFAVDYEARIGPRAIAAAHRAENALFDYWRLRDRATGRID